MNTAFKNLKEALSLGADHTIKCPACNGYLAVTSGSRNITVTACNHLRGNAFVAILHLGMEKQAKITELAVKTPEQLENGAWDGVVFKIAK